jgi:two-component system sensor histidine kinase PilS (NtrC family)
MSVWTLTAFAAVLPGLGRESGGGQFWLTAGFYFTLAIFFGFLLLLRLVLKMFRGSGGRTPAENESTARPLAAGDTAFASASVQAVIQRLREKERELDRLNREQKERAADTERLTEAVTRHMPTGLLLVNSNGLINVANPAAEQTLSVGALQYRRYSEVLGPDSQLTRLLESCLKEGRTYQREEVQHHTAAGELRHLGLTLSPVARDAQKVTGALCLLSDLTELSALQGTVRLKESLAALGEMSAGIAHEFKNSLATMAAYAQLIQQEIPSGDVAENATKILEETRSLTHVVTEFLRFARPMELSRERVLLPSLVERVLAEAGESHPRVEFRAEGDFGAIAGDESLLRQALQNLLRNAAEVVSTTRPQVTPAGHVVLRGGHGEVGGRPMQRLAVADDGPGIPEAELSKLFIPFYTTKPDGTGLGLAVVQKIAVQHGGSAEARNLPGGGAEFILWLPVDEVPPAGS